MKTCDVLPACIAYMCSRQVAEEVKFEPKVTCEVMEESVTFKQADLLHGDILLVQRALTEVYVTNAVLDPQAVLAHVFTFLQACHCTVMHSRLYGLTALQPS